MMFGGNFKTNSQLKVSYYRKLDNIYVHLTIGNHCKASITLAPGEVYEGNVFGSVCLSVSACLYCMSACSDAQLKNYPSD